MPLIKCPACQHDISDQAQACPNCGHPLAKQTTKAPKKHGCLGIATLLALAIAVGIPIIANLNKTGVTASFDPSKPETITAIISETTAHPTASFEAGKLSLTYSIDPWMLTASTAKSTFLYQAKRFFKEAFTSPAVQSACVEGTATFHDIRGNDSRGKAIQLCMSRDNARRVNWNNIDTDKLPQIADTSFIHPGFK